MVHAYVGHAYLLADRPKEAIAYLRHAANACMSLDDQFDQVHAKLDLGLALEQTGDPKGACEAFGKVLAQWGHATPRSISADAAREGVTRLSCGVSAP
jgi:serine/threonine-protein kinase